MSSGMLREPVNVNISQLKCSSLTNSCPFTRSKGIAIAAGGKQDGYMKACLLPQHSLDTQFKHSQIRTVPELHIHISLSPSLQHCQSQTSITQPSPTLDLHHPQTKQTSTSLRTLPASSSCALPSPDAKTLTHQPQDTFTTMCVIPDHYHRRCGHTTLAPGSYRIYCSRARSRRGCDITTPYHTITGRCDDCQAEYEEEMQNRDFERRPRERRLRQQGFPDVGQGGPRC